MPTQADIDIAVQQMRRAIHRALRLETMIPLDAFGAIMDAAEKAAREEIRRRVEAAK